MALYGKIPEDPMKKVLPRTGPPVPNMGGIPRQPVVSPTPPVRTPTVAGGPPGPAASTPPWAKRLSVAASSFAPTEPTGATPGSPVVSSPAAPTPAAPAPAETPRQRAARQAAQRGKTPTTQTDPLEQQISDYITKALGGGAGAYDDAMVSRYKAAAKSAAEGQRRATVDVGNEDLAQRGLFRSGLGARMAGDAARGAGASYTQAVADIMNQKATADQAARESALQGALNFYQTRTGNELQRKELASRNRGGGPSTFQYMDPETGQVYELPLELLG